MEGTSADRRHYLARLARRSRCIKALTMAVDMFVRFYNARQLKKGKCPRCHAPLTAMILTFPGKNSLDNLAKATIVTAFALSRTAAEQFYRLHVLSNLTGTFSSFPFIVKMVNEKRG